MRSEEPRVRRSRGSAHSLYLHVAAERGVVGLIALGFLGCGLGVSGREEDALRILRKVENLSEDQYVPPFQKGHILAGLGRLDEAFELFEEAYRLRSPQLVLWNGFPQLDYLRSDPRFRSLMRRIGFEAEPD